MTKQNSFYESIVSTQANESYTENGALGFKTTNKAILDFLFKLSSYRDSDCTEDFKKVLDEKNPYVLKFLFYIRDIRGGLGERETFRKCLKLLLDTVHPSIESILKFISIYGRYDDMLCLLDEKKYQKQVISFIKKQLESDLTFITEQPYPVVEDSTAPKSASLLAKWLPSENASNKQTKHYAYIIMQGLKMSPKKYRQTLSKLRNYLNIVERNTCANKWEDINYNAVPSLANIKYKDAFIKHDETRRREYLNKLAVGDKSVKINSSVNFPHDVTHIYSDIYAWGGRSIKAYDEATEQLWKNLKQIDGLKDTIVVRDDSGSMECPLGSNTNITALEVATALGIYCAQHNSPAYRNKIISFSETPRYLDFSDPQKFGSLHSILDYLYKHSEIANTNIKAVFDLILRTAINNKLKANELPKQILIISDMEFDNGASNIPLFSEIEKDYTQYGYKLPKLIFWNTCSRTNTIPVTQNDKGVILVSGFSANILEMINTNTLDPYKALINILSKDRYKDIPLIKWEYSGRK